MNVIPAIDLRQGKCVRLYQGDFDQQTDYGNEPASLAQEYESIGFNALHIVDLDGALSGQQLNRSIIREIVEKGKLAVQLGGGIRDKAHIEPWLATGLTRVVIGSLRTGDEWQVCQYTGDAKRSSITQRCTSDWITEVQDRGAGEIVLNCMNSDGVRDGYDIEQLVAVQELCSLLLVASGGAGHMQDFVDVFKTTNVSAALAASVFHSSEIAIPELKRFLQSANIEVRL